MADDTKPAPTLPDSAQELRKVLDAKPPAPTLTRYAERRREVDGGKHYVILSLQPSETGAWVKWADVDALLRAREQELAEERHKVKVLELAGQEIINIHRAREQELADASTALDELVAPDENGTDLIAAERARQARVEGWTPAHDDSHQSQELLDAAECYIEQVIHPQSPPSRFVDSQVRPVWPWEASWWKPSDDPVRNLVKAGALIAAEIDRLLRAAAADGAGRTHDERAE